LSRTTLLTNHGSSSKKMVRSRGVDSTARSDNHYGEGKNIHAQSNSSRKEERQTYWCDREGMRACAANWMVRQIENLVTQQRATRARHRPPNRMGASGDTVDPDRGQCIGGQKDTRLTGVKGPHLPWGAKMRHSERRDAVIARYRSAVSRF